MHEHPDDDPRALAAAAMRRLGNAMVAYETDEDLLLRIAREADATAAIVEAGPRRRRPIADIKRHLWDTPPPDGGPMSHFQECVVSGRANPMGIAAQVRRVGDRAVADVVLGAAFEGAPKRAHGGAVAAIMDDVMGYVLVLERTPAFTGRLNVAYRAPTPVEEPLVAEAWLEKRDERKLFLRATLKSADDTLIADAEGLFIAIPLDRGGGSGGGGAPPG